MYTSLFLAPFTRYSIIVTARNGIGYGNENSLLNVFTEQKGKLYFDYLRLVYIICHIQFQRGYQVLLQGGHHIFQ